MIDRPIRPLFPKDWRYDTQLVAIPLSIDHVHPYDILAMNGASAALMISDIPLPTPVGAVRIGKIDGNFVVNPPEEDLLGGLGTSENELRPRSDRGRHRGRDPDGRGGRQRDPRGGDPRRARHRPRGDQEAVRAAARPRRQSRQGEERVRADPGRRAAARADPRLARRGAGRRHPGRGQARAPGRHQGRRGGDPRAVRSERARRRLRRGSSSRPRSAVPPRSWRSTSSRSRSSASASPCTRSAPTGAPRTRSATSRSKSA